MISRCFVFFFLCFFFSFVWRMWGEGDKGALLGSSVFGLGQELVKGGKNGHRCHGPSGRV